MPSSVINVASTELIYGPSIAIAEDTPSVNVAYSVLLYASPTENVNRRWGLVDLSWDDDTPPLFPFQADIATWYGMGVVRTYYAPIRLYKTLTARVWPDSDLIGRTIEVRIDSVVPRRV